MRPFHIPSLRTLPPVALPLALLLLGPAYSQALDWEVQLGTGLDDTPADVAVDASGNIYSGGATFGDLAGAASVSNRTDGWVARHDPSGQPMWVRQFGSSQNDRVTGVDSDGSGGLFAAGWTLGTLPGQQSSGSLDAWLVRLDGAGNTVWLNQMGTSDRDQISGLVHDGQGGLFVAGTTEGSLGGPAAGGPDVWLMRADGAGNPLWTRQFGTTGEDAVEGLRSNGAGGVLVFGYAVGALVGPHVGNGDAWIASYSPSGAELWSAQVGTTSFDYITDAAADGAGGAFVVGSTNGSFFGFGSSSGQDAFVMHLDATGLTQWTRQIRVFERDMATGVTLDSTGRVIVTGHTTDGGIGGSNRGSRDGWLARFRADGLFEWATQLGTTGFDEALAIGTTPTGGVVVAGRTDGNLAGTSAGGDDIWLQRIESDLEIEVTRYCYAQEPHSDGSGATMIVSGSHDLADNRVELAATGLAPLTFGFFLTSRIQGFTVNPGGSAGTLCLGGPIGRYVGPGQVQNTGSSYAIELPIDLTQMPQPTGSVGAQVGESWNFQAWFRSGAVGGSDLTDAVTLIVR